MSTVTLRFRGESMAWQKSCGTEKLRDGHGHHDLLGTDHYFFQWGLGSFLKNIPAQQKLLEKKIVRGEPWGKKLDQVLLTYQVLCLTKKKFLLKLLPTKKGHAHLKVRKIPVPENCPTHLKKIMVRPLMFIL